MLQTVPLEKRILGLERAEASQMIKLFLTQPLAGRSRVHGEGERDAKKPMPFRWALWVVQTLGDRHAAPPAPVIHRDMIFADAPLHDFRLHVFVGGMYSLPARFGLARTEVTIDN